MSNAKPITFEQAVAQVAGQLDGPTPVGEFVKRVLVIHPSRAKRPEASIRAKIYNRLGRDLVYLDRGTVIPMRVVMQGVRFRYAPSPLEVRRRFLLVEPAFHGFMRYRLAPKDMQLLAASGETLPTHIIQIKQEHKSVLGDYTYEMPAFDLRKWFKATRIRNGDSILVTVEDWQAGRFRLEHEPVGQRRFDEIDRKNQELADLIFDMLEASYYEYVWDIEAVATAYARMADPRGYPGDHWTDVIERDPRMKWNDYEIRYIEHRSPIESILAKTETFKRVPKTSFSKAAGRQVYRFKAALAYRRDLWRRIEIQGQQTLADFDRILRDAFEHDFFDHMGGFWQRIRRGTGRRFREVELGSIDPMGGGDGAQMRVARLGLQPGDELKYVYDFGDWIEHRITLEEIVEPEPGANYPRVVAQNRPRYRYCEDCKAEGRKTVATWICLQCSNEQGREVLVCKDCLMAYHEDHYANKIMY